MRTIIALLVQVAMFVSYTNGKAEECDQNIRRNQFENAAEKLTTIACFLCSNETCDFSNPSCNQVSEYADLPAYNNLLQFAFQFILSVGELTLRVLYGKQGNSDCFFQLDLKETRYSVKISFSDCNGKSCTVVEELDIQLYFILFTLKFNDKNQQVFVMFQTKGLIFEIGNTENHRYFNLTCKTNQKLPTARYQFFHKNSKITEHYEVLMVPCSPGGFFINPEDGKLANGSYLTNITDQTNSSVISILLDINKTDVFPVKSKNGTNTPEYIDEKGKPKKPEDMKPNQDATTSTSETITKLATLNSTDEQATTKCWFSGCELKGSFFQALNIFVD